MKQLLFMTIMTAICVTGAVVHAFWGVFLYYIFAVLRPQYLWEWSLPQGIRWSLIAAIAAIIGVVLSAPKIITRGRWNRVATLIIIYGSLLILSTFNAINSQVASRWGTEYAKIIIMAIIATIVIDHLRHVKYLAIMIFLCIGYIAYEINSLYVFDNRLDIFHYGYGGLDNNGAGLMLAMGIPFAYCFFRHASNVWLRIACAVVGLMMIHAVLMSYSRGAMLSALVGAAWLLWHYRPRMHAAVTAVVMIVLVGIMAGPEITKRFVSIQGYEEDGSAQSRIESWNAAWKMAWDHPLTGVGIRNANLLSYNYGADKYGRTIHSQYLQVAADSGIPTLIIYLSLCFIAIRRMRRIHATIEEIHVIKHGDLPPPKNAIDPIYGSIALAVETSLIIFCFGGVFLSLEVFELPWLLLVMAGVLPELAKFHLEQSQPKTHAQKNRPQYPVSPYPFQPALRNS